VDLESQDGVEERLPLFNSFPDVIAKELPIRIWPDPILHKLSMPIANEFGTLELKQLIVDMFHTMRINKGVGLAAPQVGICKRVITMEVEPNVLVYFINPIIVESSDTNYKWEEGCLSVPGYFEFRERPNDINVWTNDVDGKLMTVRLQGLYAFALQHEMDHLAGKVFVDDLSQFKKDRVKVKVKKTLRNRNRIPL
jgi:peptide deformylase